MKEQVIKRIRELCPELQTLEFGCEVTYGKDTIKTGRIVSKMKNDCYTILNDTNTLRANIPESDMKEILGKPIHLEDVLRAIRCVKGGRIAITAEGMILEREFGSSAYDCAGIKDYDLTKPFSDQSDDVYAFLNTLIN